MPEMTVERARAELLAAGITGPHVSHSRRGTIEKISALLERSDPGVTFGLEIAEHHDAQGVMAAMARLTGCPPDVCDVEIPDEIDPDLTIAGLVAAGRRLRDAASGGATLLAVTGHPTGVLELYIRIADAFGAAGGKILRPREGEGLPIGPKGAVREVRYVGNVGCLADWGALKHTHSPEAMQALLEGRPWPDLVLADHGFAGAAIQAGIPTIAIMDINDHALAVAEAEGRDVTIVPLDDNRSPGSYEPAWALVSQIVAGTG